VAVVDKESTLSWQALAQWLTPQLAPYQRPIRYLSFPPALQQGGIKLSRQRLLQWLHEENPD
ncbi:MAG: o-succinylbenzoate--CoA ligase, partial [Enterobacteriaceae bacterium]